MGVWDRMSDIRKIAFNIMRRLCADRDVCKAYATIAAFLERYPEMSSKAVDTIDDVFLQKHAAAFLKGRNNNGPGIPQTVPDERLKDILHVAYNVSNDQLERAIQYHLEAMDAENFLGWILEAYIAAKSEPLGWAWCTGSIIRAVDFIKQTDSGWIMLQIKNRSHSENSSSAKVREGTAIKRWFRVYAKDGRCNRAQFPDEHLQAVLSEEGFRKFIVAWLKKNFLRKQ